MAEAFALIFLLPIFVTILSVLVLKEHVGWRRWSAVVAGFVGVLVVLRPGFRVLGIGHLAAIVCGLVRRHLDDRHAPGRPARKAHHPVRRRYGRLDAAHRRV